MSNNRLEFRGLNEMREALRKLPEDLAGEARQIVFGAANGAAVEIRSNYGQHRKTGNLQDHVTVTRLETGRAAAGAVVKSTSRLAFIFEFGTQARHYVTVRGRRHATGKMPPFHAFIPVVVRARLRMYEDLKDIVRRAGFRVSGNA